MYVCVKDEGVISYTATNKSPQIIPVVATKFVLIVRVLPPYL